MPYLRKERRIYERRPVKIPVAYSDGTDENTRTGYSFAWTVNVHARGICVRAKPGRMPEKGSMLVFVVMPDTGDRFDRTEVSVKIPGRVVWTDIETGCFGTSFTDHS